MIVGNICAAVGICVCMCICVYMYVRNVTYLHTNFTTSTYMSYNHICFGLQWVEEMLPDCMTVCKVCVLLPKPVFLGTLLGSVSYTIWLIHLKHE